MAKFTKKLINSPFKIGHGIHRARKTDHKKHPKELKHERKWIENKMNNK